MATQTSAAPAQFVVIPAPPRALAAFQVKAVRPSRHAGGEVLMKRLILPFVTAAACAIAAPAFAQSKDFSGSWTLDVEKSGTKDGPAAMIFTMTDKELTARAGHPNAPAMTFALDGTETVMKEGAKTKAAWKGNKLDATVIDKNGIAETLTISRDGAWLVMETNSRHGGPLKLYFKKTPAKL
jgi:hypothetical protein